MVVDIELLRLGRYEGGGNRKENKKTRIVVVMFVG
jgi:hypothetical protein